ncbi:MAG: peptide deformylase [Trichodesmium sp. St16_bin4-tuft]|nr:peptide deformylase [Trichodesmium sp. MAG_R01]MDE5070271.1 peptide deformylase [Trichodesmium sp. St4_bin8_1]MDE5099577.1 peptide deformylase [Trichodesmium sp. St16_bin4-tuft]
MDSEIIVNKEKLENSPLEIYYLGDRSLRQSAKRVAKVDSDMRKLVREMLQTMYTADGIGLAAPQVNVQKQVIVIDCEPTNSATPPLVLINPTIKKYSNDICLFQEGCLSIPGVYLDVQRPSEIEVAYKDENGRPQTLQAQELLSRAIQHEMDHLQGILFVDRVENKLALNEELAKYKFSAKDVKSIA